MVFKYYPRYTSLAILIGFNLLIFFVAGLVFGTYIFFIISAIVATFLFMQKYKIENDTLSEYIFFIKIKEIDISSINKVEIVDVKKIGTINIYIGKDAKENKEDGYYLHLDNGKKIKVRNGYRNKDRLSVGKYIIKVYHKKSKYVEKHKLTNDYF